MKRFFAPFGITELTIEFAVVCLVAGLLGLAVYRQQQAATLARDHSPAAIESPQASTPLPAAPVVLEQQTEDGWQ